jgi:hypothetical protein
MTIKLIKIDVDFLINLFQFISNPNEDFHTKQSAMSMLKKYFNEYWVNYLYLI